MKTYTYYYDNLIPTDNILKYSEKDDILYFDIETTGLSRVKNKIYLIGCGYYSENGLNIIQWFAENENEEVDVLKSFTEFSSSFGSLVNYNGKSFDIPFTYERMKQYGITMPQFNSTDIFTLIKPLKKLLSLNDLTQKSIETFLNVTRIDKYNGGELIYVYKKYTQFRNKDDLNKLLLHNKEDVLNMHYISRITDYLVLLNTQIYYKSHSEKDYYDYNGKQCNELILNSSSEINACLNNFKSFYNNESGSFIMNFTNHGDVLIRIPIINSCMKYFILNYKDYYYLPDEDICIFKSMAGGIEKDKRINAKRDTCFVKCSDSFIPIFDKQLLPSEIKTFKIDYKSKIEYIRLIDFIEMTNSEKTLYVTSVFQSFI